MFWIKTQEDSFNLFMSSQSPANLSVFPHVRVIQFHPIFIYFLFNTYKNSHSEQNLSTKAMRKIIDYENKTTTETIRNNVLYRYEGFGVVTLTKMLHTISWTTFAWEWLWNCLYFYFYYVTILFIFFLLNVDVYLSIIVSYWESDQTKNEGNL